ncbi:squalene/phytoene synthase family protein [Wenxinia saemankumensis]|uniref:Farnesyl-diphosphate farnesyltransferase n=1 Tax=Wenxinia saemankumensis TaxID=1447782 RepID=A0A1M6D0V8_9RHOB|nr:squalene/phytoene synthase family protein [Wenxinia saemankumensis]SHI66850.1 farnesyl-diphosphate farnesyltransferase [Wenxinia saemankumensis]
MNAYDPAMHLPARIIVEGAGSSFRAGMRLLPRGRREAILALYAFCRAVDDIADEPGPAPAKARALDAWEAEIRLAATGDARTPVGRDLARAMTRHDLPLDEFLLVIEGMRMDVSGVRAPDRDTLDAYIRRVAGAVGLLSIRIFGAWRGPRSERFALALARALQLTNILRDVEEDAAIGRIYLPADLLRAHGIADDPATLPAAPGLPALRRTLAAEARAEFRAAAEAARRLPRLRIAPALMMMGPYDRLLAAIEADPTRPPRARPRWAKAADGIACILRGGKSGR